MTTTTGWIGNLGRRFEHGLDRPALLVDDREISHAELSERVARWRGGLAEVGVQTGHRVAIMAPNDDRFVAAHLAVIGLGAISIPLNPQCPAPELARELEAVAVEVVIAEASHDPVLAPALERLAAGGVTPQRIDPSSLDGSAPHAIFEVEPDQPAVILFTSGTAGPARPAVLTHQNLEAALGAILALPTDLVAKPPVILGIVPLFHILGLTTVLHLGLLLGGSIVLSEFGGGAATLALIERHRVTVALGPPTLWRALSQPEVADPGLVESITLALSGASELPGAVKLAVGDRLGLHLEEGYGLTETAAVVASTVGVPAPPGSVGRLLPGVEARIVDEMGQDSLIGDPGQLLVRGAMVFPGYWTPDGLDRGPLSDDGWLRTGDIAVVDDTGDLAIIGRSKDLVIVSGFNVHPAEVETVLLDHPDVAEVGVVGEPSVDTGEAIVAFVVPGPGRTVEEGELRAHCQAELARYKVPRRFVIAADLPIGPTGKLQRNQLR